MVDMEVIDKLLKQAAEEGIITCTGCGTNIEPDCPRCGKCWTENPLIKNGYI